MKVEYDNPAYEKGLEVDLGGISVPNGGSVELSKDQHDLLVAKHGPLSKFFKGPFAKYSGKEGGDN